MLLALLAACTPQAEATPAVAGPARVELPRGPAAVALAAIGPDVRSAPLDWGGLPLSDDAADWARPGTWSAWAEAVRAEAAARGADPLRASRLALVARLQGRDDDAWEHFANLAGAPEHAAALLPLFLPGVAPAELVSLERHAGAAVGRLPDGVVLRPAPPPQSRHAEEVRLGYPTIERRSMRIDGLEIGAARVDFVVALESDGIQVDVTHKSGGQAKFFVCLPELPDFAIFVQYDDWVRQDTVGVPLEITVAPGDETHSLFGRFEPRRIAWPTELPTRASHALAKDGLVLRLASDDPRLARAAAASVGLARLLDAPCRVETEPEPRVPGVRIELADDPSGRKWGSILSLAERWALAHPSNAQR
ncbi:MAG: hypothetical protein L6Q99_01130 [Planctomycetes bacterium]|nr:hypothetical protein [Planctomycetota bacterium]